MNTLIYLNYCVNIICRLEKMMNRKENHILVSVTFDDYETAEKIMSTSDPRKQKSLGRQVQNFDKTIWKNKCQQVVKDGNRAKVSEGM